MNLNDKKTINRLIYTLKNIEKHIEFLTADIKNLIRSVKNLIFCKNTIIGIENFHLAWEYFFNSCMKKIFGEDVVFDEDEICIDKSEDTKFIIKPDTIIINKNGVNEKKSTLHIYDCKYKDFPKNEVPDKDWIKQSIYIDNFLNTEINPLENNLLVDSNIYLIYPGSKFFWIKSRVYNHNIYFIQLDILELLKIYNGTIDIS